MKQVDLPIEAITSGNIGSWLYAYGEQGVEYLDPSHPNRKWAWTDDAGWVGLSARLTTAMVAERAGLLELRTAMEEREALLAAGVAPEAAPIVSWTPSGVMVTQPPPLDLGIPLPPGLEAQWDALSEADQYDLLYLILLIRFGGVRWQFQ